MIGKLSIYGTNQHCQIEGLRNSGIERLRHIEDSGGLAMFFIGPPCREMTVSGLESWKKY